ncbi:SHOCT domain-containing protein [Niabella beijingensis]|uniref:SHOCT domain-containing protein n=1 Tax=Niabella beijingensis TaxID=2872700 RepID=UPI001CBBE93E|nr:SHOCT domain-containing protein [Niabella beijingensis]MBZ4189916.1 SHOCT domain-containing protein [Niabella beijingensis]
MKPKVALKEVAKSGYRLDNGWVWKTGDTVYFGKGTLPTKHFAFVYESETSWYNVLGGPKSGNDAMNDRISLKSNEAKRGVIKKITLTGTEKGGYTAIGVVGLGGAANYWIEIDNAVESGEIRSPKQYAVNNPAEPLAPASSSKTDQLKELKKLLDDGTLTQKEFDAEKKKILSSQ